MSVPPDEAVAAPWASSATRTLGAAAGFAAPMAAGKYGQASHAAN